MQTLHPILNKLKGGDLRSKGRADEVAADILRKPELFDVILNSIYTAEPVVSMRAADAAAKAASRMPSLIQHHKRLLLGRLSGIARKEVRWHVAEMITMLRLTPAERRRAFEILVSYLEDDSRIVRAAAIGALGVLAVSDETLRGEILPIIRMASEIGAPSVRARARKTLREYENLVRD